MIAADLIRAGKLSEARATLVQGVRDEPGNLELRLLLFKVLSFLGEWDKARLHLETVAVTGAGRPEIPLCLNLLAAEREREEVRLHRRLPEFLTAPPDYLAEFLEARAGLSKGEGERLASLLPVLEQRLGLLSGTVEGVPFDGFIDLDATLLPFLEVFIHDRYLWFPLTSLRELSVQAPASLLDLLWTPARIVTWDGVTTDCVLPALYPGSWSHASEEVRMGRRTEWEATGGYGRGAGQHLFLVGEEEKGLLELREVVFNFGDRERQP
jgi:type VI secretion system protein ImpE